MATRAFHLGLENKPIIHKINQRINRGIHNREKSTVMVKINHTILKIIQTRATVLL
jgi:hypothetical protein